MRGGIGWWSLSAVLIVVVLLTPIASPAQDQPETAPLPNGAADPQPRHRFDLGLQRLDSPDEDLLTTLFGYTTTFLNDMSFSAAVTLSHSTTYTPPGDETSTAYHLGIGDTFLTYSIVPGQKITASPWVPRSIGFSVLLVLPTGDVEDFLGGDMYVIAPQAGWVVRLNENFSLLPAIRYTASFAEGDFAVPAHQLSAELGLVWAHRAGWWVNYLGEVVRDFEQDDWYYNDTFLVGKMFGEKFGLSVAYGVLERVDPNANRNDFEWMLLFHYVISQ